MFVFLNLESVERNGKKCKKLKSQEQKELFSENKILYFILFEEQSFGEKIKNSEQFY